MSLGLPITDMIAGGLLGTFLITPDLDLSGQVRVSALKNWGILGGLWYPLGAAVKHRGITHTFFRGPLLLIGYFCLIIGFLAGLLWWIISVVPFPHSFPPLSTLTVHLPGILAGYVLMYWLHLWMDGYSLRNRERW